MPIVALPSESLAACGYAVARSYSGVALSPYAEVATAFPGSDAAARLSAELDDVMIDCRAPGWDGYGAEAVSIPAYIAAQRFIRSLPAGIPVPKLAADTDGCINFEWHVSSRRTFAVSVHPDYKLDFAALLGSTRIHGSEPFFTTDLPDSIRQLVRRIHAA
ncbi:MAG: hypothetical protein ABIP20_20030 [Chthoniobacteraceae bacterium]